jgi:hypothetical protein
MDFVLGRVTRDHIDIDWVALIDDAPAISAALDDGGYQTIPGPPPDQQLDVAKDGEEMSFAWLARGPNGQVASAGGLYAGELWPEGMLEGPLGRIGAVQCPVISVAVQIESKEMWHEWVPASTRRPKDAEDIARLRQALEARQ